MAQVTLDVTVWISDGHTHLERTSPQPWGRVPTIGETLAFDVTLPYPQVGPDAVTTTRQAQLWFDVGEVRFPDGKPPVVKCFVPDCPPDELEALRAIGFKGVGPR